jgi:hypothetical protein
MRRFSKAALGIVLILSLGTLLSACSGSSKEEKAQLAIQMEEMKQLATTACSYIDDVYESKTDFSSVHDEIAATFDNPADKAKYALAGEAFLELSKLDLERSEEFLRYSKVLTIPDPLSGQPWSNSSRSALNSARVSEAWTFCGGWGGYGGIGDIRPDEYGESDLETYLASKEVLD